MPDILEPFTREPFTHDGITRDVYWLGTGPGVVLLPEIPQIMPSTVELAQRLVDAGYTVALPSLFGTAGEPDSARATIRSVASVCVAREFSVLARNASSPITDWLRALARTVHERAGGPGVGAIGMCFTGNFALAMMLEPALLAPVMSQPSLPFGVSPSHRRALHVSPEDCATIRRRLKEADSRLLALRFSEDALCPRERFATLRRTFGDRAETIEIDSGRGNPHGISRRAHSVLTRDLVDEAGHPTRHALDRVLALFADTLGSEREGSAG